MKKLISLAMAALITACMTVTAFAEPVVTGTEVIQLEDGCYAVVTTVEEELETRAASQTKNASKNYKAYNRQNKLLWTYTLTGQFTYNGTTSKATSAKDSYKISNSDWSKDYSKATKSGDTVYGEATFSCPIEELSCELEITCDEDGNID